MAVDGFMAFKLYDNSLLQAEAAGVMVDKSPLTDDASIIGYDEALKARALFQIDDYGLDIVQTLNIGSQSTGAGAGRVTFDPFRITRRPDQASPKFFEMSCSGTPFKFASLFLRKTGASPKAGFVFLRFDFKLIAVKMIAWSNDDGGPREVLTLEYGGLQVRYVAQNADGSFKTPAIVGGWNRVRNVQDQSATPL